MNTETITPSEDQTEVRFDLRSILTPDEITKFKEAAKAAGAKSLTEHFVNLTLKPRIAKLQPA